MNFCNPYFQALSQTSMPMTGLAQSPLLNSSLAHLNSGPISTFFPKHTKSQLNYPILTNFDESDSILYGPFKKWRAEEFAMGSARVRIEPNRQEFKTEFIKIEENHLISSQSLPINPYKKLDFGPLNQISSLNFPTQRNTVDAIDLLDLMNQSQLVTAQAKIWDGIPFMDLLHYQFLNQPSYSLEQFYQDSGKTWDMSHHNLLNFKNFERDRQNMLAENSRMEKNYGIENEIILIEDDEDTCQTTPQSPSQNQQNPQQLQSKNSSPLHSLEILDLKNCNFLDQTSQCQPEKNILIDVSSQVPEVSHSYNKATSKTVSRAVIPKLELNSVGLKKKRVTRPIKQVWNPESYDFEVWIEKVEKALGMKITNQEKVIKTLESYEGNIEITLSKIRRNKAYYKNYFKVQRIERVQNPYA